MKNVIISSRMGLALALQVIFVIASQMLPGSLAVDKGSAAAAPARVYPFVAQGEFTSIDFPGATLTRAFGINTNGDIVGTYVAGGVQHAFVRSAQELGNH
jgi:hypothetical protein